MQNLAVVHLILDIFGMIQFSVLCLWETLQNHTKRPHHLTIMKCVWLTNLSVTHNNHTLVTTFSVQMRNNLWQAQANICNGFPILVICLILSTVQNKLEVSKRMYRVVSCSNQKHTIVFSLHGINHPLFFRTIFFYTYNFPIPAHYFWSKSQMMIYVP